MAVELVEVDYRNPVHGQHLLQLMDAYAADPMGGGMPLDPVARGRLVEGLSARSDALSILAYIDGSPVGLVNCFEGYSTFKAKPLINLHDVVVLPAYRGRGIAKQMLERVEALAKGRGCYKITLEVLSQNTAAQAAYRKLGYAGYRLDEATGHALFWENVL